MATILRVVREMCGAIREEIGLPASAGIGGTRIIAKIASGRAKPAGVLFVPRGGERDFLRPLDVRKFPGIGPRAEERLHAIGIKTLSGLVDLSKGDRAPFERMASMVDGEMQGQGTHALGRERPAFSEHDPEGLHVGSISNERTFFSSLDDDGRVLDQLLALTERVCWRARKRGMRARTVALKLRYRDFHTLTRTLTASPSADEKVLFERVQALFRRAHTRRLGVRLVGVALSNLVEDDAPSPVPTDANRRIGDALDSVRGKWGYNAVRLGAAVPTDKSDPSTR